MKILLLLEVFIIMVWVQVTEAKENDIKKTLKSVIIDRIEYEAAPIDMVVIDLRQRLKKLDHSHKNLNIILTLSKGKKAENYKVDIHLEKIPLDHALRYITQVAGLGYFVKDNTIVIADKDLATENMETQTFIIRPSHGILNEPDEKDKKKKVVEDF